MSFLWTQLKTLRDIRLERISTVEAFVLERVKLSNILICNCEIQLKNQIVILRWWRCPNNCPASTLPKRCHKFLLQPICSRV